jgi:hypothetical protein
MGLGSVKLGMGCRHFKASFVMFSGRYGNSCCSVSKFGHSVVMYEYSVFCMLFDGLVMCRFYEWNFCSICGRDGSGFGLLVSFLIRFVVHCVEFSPINWLHCVGVGANVMSIA